MISSNIIPVIFLNITAIGLLILAVYIFFKNPKNPTFRSLAIMTGSAALWMAIGSFRTYLISSGVMIPHITNWMGPFGCMIFPALLCFTLNFPAKSRNFKPLFEIILYLPFIISAILCFNGKWFTNQRIVNGVYLRDYLIAFNIFAVFAIIYLIISAVNLIYKYRHLSSALDRLKMRYVFLGSVFTVSFGTFFSLILPLLGNNSFWDLGMGSGVFTVVFFSYAMLKHRLLDIEIVISHSIGYAVAITFVIFGYIGLIALFGRFLEQFVGYSNIIVSASSALIIAFLFQPLQSFIQRYIYTKFFAGRFEYQKSLLQVSRELVTRLNLEDLLNFFVEALKQHIGVEQVTFLLRREERPVGETSYYVHAHRGIEPEIAGRFKVKNGLINWFYNEKDAFVKEEMKLTMADEGFHTLYDNLHKIGADVLVPVFIKDKLEGIITIGSKNNGRSYSQSDIDTLNILSTQVGIGIENARLYGEAVTDDLTSLFNRRYFDYHLKEELLRAQRYKRSLSLFMIDIDHFKQINDQFGHQFGDYVLKELGRLLRSSVRSVDIVCRYGAKK